jgi:glycopeptide antibiotics resistance protein
VTKSNVITILVTLFGAALVFYFSWLPNPNIGIKSYFPHWLGEWTNKNGNLRTAVPFVFLGFLLEIGFVDYQDIRKKRLIILAILITIVFVAELGQLYLPLRHFDIEDILWGIFGSILGLYAGKIAKRTFSR